VKEHLEDAGLHVHDLYTPRILLHHRAKEHCLEDGRPCGEDGPVRSGQRTSVPECDVRLRPVQVNCAAQLGWVDPCSCCFDFLTV
jgi:hypothetical protein